VSLHAGDGVGHLVHGAIDCCGAVGGRLAFHDWRISAATGRLSPRDQLGSGRIFSVYPSRGSGLLVSPRRFDAPRKRTGPLLPQEPKCYWP
jgi:hypothetical protein